jgi:lipopolysaccharide assembly outer membrane protein LptD (OstA)
MKKYLSVGLFVLLGMTLAAAGSRVIEIEGGRQQGDLRFGPYKYSEGVKATVQKLQIASPEGSLTAPQGLEMSKAQGKRTAAFSGSVVVTRSRLTAKGPSLEYKEETGLGVLAGPTNIVQKPEKAGEDDVLITAAKATFDVDNNISTSEGGVKLVNGKQSAISSKVVFDEETNLGCLTDSKTVTLVREPKKAGDTKLVITAKEARVNTDKNTVIATGGVTLVAGKNTTTGDSLYYDDEKNIAYIVGKPAKNVDKKNGGSISGTTLVNNTAKEQVLVGTPFKIPFDSFKCPNDNK